MRVKIQPIELGMDDLEALLKRAEGAVSKEDHQTLRHLVESYIYVLELVGDKQTTIKRLRKILFGAKTEKTRNVAKDVQKAAELEGSGPPATEKQAEAEPSKKQDGSAKAARGHGHNGAEAYSGAELIWVSHQTLKPGDACPCCQQGKVYKQSKPRVIVRLRGQAPVQAKVYELERYRCNLCGEQFSAEPPEGIGSQKYDPTTASIIAVLRYSSGLPFTRLERLQEGMGIPLPSSTQWDIVNETATEIEPAYKQLIREAAQGEVVYNDDTPMRVLELMGKRASQKVPRDGPAGRKGVFTSSVISTREGRRIALFFTGQKHAGENLQEVLVKRSSALGPPIQMCDALSRNLPKDLEVILANCLAHSRRRFVELAELFPEPVLHVLEVLKEVYAIDARAKEQGLSAEQRLGLHQAESGPLMKQLHEWLLAQFQERHVEPNSSLGEAINYMLKHWEQLTLFLRQPGAPLDNNISERALKMSIIHRKNSLFFKSERGSCVGDIFMSLIHTCQLCGADPFDYLTELQHHAQELARDPQVWMPWNYRARVSADSSN